MKSLYRKLLQVQLGKDPDVKMPKSGIRRGTERRLSAKGKVLIIDDEPSYLELASYHLEAEGYSVLTAASAKEARTKLQSNTDICLVITDLKMPFEDGFTVLEFLRSNLRFNHIPAIVATCCTDYAYVKRAIERGATDFVAKPYTGPSLLERVKRTLDRSSGAILLVVDEELQRSILERDLTAAGYQIHVATDVLKAKAMILEKDFAVVIADLVLDDGTGLDLMLEAKEAKPAIEFIFLQDQALHVTDDEVRSAGGCGVIERPIKNVDVLRAVRAACTK